MQLGGSAPSQYGEVAHEKELAQDEPPTNKLVRDEALRCGKVMAGCDWDELQKRRQAFQRPTGYEPGSQAADFMQQAAQGIPAPHWPKEWGGNPRLTQESFRQSMTEMLQAGEITEENAFLRVQKARSLGWCV